MLSTWLGESLGKPPRPSLMPGTARSSRPCRATPVSSSDSSNAPTIQFQRRRKSLTAASVLSGFGFRPEPTLEKALLGLARGSGKEDGILVALGQRTHPRSNCFVQGQQKRSCQRRSFLE